MCRGEFEPVRPMACLYEDLRGVISPSWSFLSIEAIIGIFEFANVESELFTEVTVSLIDANRPAFAVETGH